MDLLTFKIAGEHYAVALDDLDEVLHMAAIKPVPGSPAFIRGVLNLHGELLPVIDLSERLGLNRDIEHRDSLSLQKDDSPYPLDTRMLLVTLEQGQQLIAILDGWNGFRTLDESRLHDGVLTAEATPDYVDGIALEDGMMLQIIMIKKMLTTDELAQLRQSR